MILNCPKCNSARIVKNGRIHKGKQRFLCRECSWQFVSQPQKKVIDCAAREVIEGSDNYRHRISLEFILSRRFNFKLSNV